MKLTKVQKIIALIVAIAVIVGVILLVWYFGKSEPVVPVTTPTISNTETEKLAQTTTSVQPVKKDYSSIAKSLEAKVINETATATDLFDLGVAYYNLGRLDDAEKTYLQVIVKDSTNSKAYGNLGNVYRDKGDFTKAEENYKKAIGLDSKNSTFYVSLAFLYNNLMNNKTAAIAILNQGLATLPGDATIQKLLDEYNK